MTIIVKYLTKRARRGALLLLPILLMTWCFSCKKYLDVRQNNQEVLLTTAADCQMLLDNYGSAASSPPEGTQDQGMNVNYPTDGEVSAGDYYLTDQGYNNADGYGIDAEDQALYTWQPGAIRSSDMPQWTVPYNVVYSANLVLECVAKIHDSTSQATLDYLRGAALFFRSYAFWNVAQLYTEPYDSSTAAQDPGIPLRLSSDINAKSSRSTVQQTYDQVIGDLKLAAALMPDNSSIASRPDKAAAYAMLARTYLSMGDYPDAFSNADSCLRINDALMDYNTLDTTSTTPFYPRYNEEVIFQSVTFADPILQPGYGYGDNAVIVPDLLAAYQDNDLRRKIFFKQNISSADYTTPDGTWYFTGNYDPTTSSNFFNGLATDEMYLVRAEGNARAGNTSAAMTDLNTLLRTRWVTNTYTDMTAASAGDALAAILTERRKELVMRGLRWTDLRRLNKDARFAVTLTRTVQGTAYTLPPNDPRYTLLIPQAVINAASGISQNAR
jgi:hypothetical protein